MSTLTVEGIEEEIKTRTTTYRNDPPILLSGYNQEKQTVQDYEGRQLLELMQNADDAKSNILQIELDTANCVLSIKNNGDAFSLEGVKSLMFTGNSTKNKEEYIGNKGLGFRSILSWVNVVSIYTQKVSFRFSESYSQAYFKQHIADSEKVRLMINDEVKAKTLQPDEMPIAALAFPEIIDNDPDQEVVTNIVLDVKKEEIGAIKKQISEIREEILLFLPNIKRLIADVDGEVQIDLEKTKDEENHIIINASHWNIYRSDTKILNDDIKKSKFKYAIAWKDDLSVEGMFYNYFPTDLPTKLPCIIHATFDLTNNRKEINETTANKHILNEIVNSLGEIADQRVKKEIADWQAYQFLSPKEHNVRKVLTSFFEQVIAKRESLACYPTLDGQYFNKEAIVYHGSVFSIWVEENEFGEYFPCLLKLPFEKMSINRRYTAASFLAIVENLNPHLTLVERVNLIGILAKNEEGYFNDLHKNTIQLPLLLNASGDEVPAHRKVFTKDTEETELKFPNYINDIEFISSELYNQIRHNFRDEIDSRKLEKESGDARAVKRFLDPIVNIGLDDITGVIQQIVSETNKVLKTEANKHEIIQQMVTSLYSIFISNPHRRGNLSTIKNIPLLSRSNEIKYTEDLYFGKEYSIGNDTERIFERIKDDSEYLAANEIYQIKAEENMLINFFKWLNVNQYTKFEILEKKLNLHETDDYSKFIISLQADKSEYVHKIYAVKKITGLEKTLKNDTFSIEKLIAWIAKDEQFLEQLRWTNSDQFYTSYNTVRRDIHVKPSYILFQILSSGITDNVVAAMPLLDLESFKVINPQNPFFTDLNIPEYKIQEIIDMLHIKKSFNDLNPEEIYQLLKESPDQLEENSQSFYKLIYEYFKTNEKTQLEVFKPNFEGLSYYCRKGGVGKDYSLQPVERCYYSDNKLLPQKILDKYWFINLPKRIGENRVAKFFGVKLIKDMIADIQLNIISENEVTNELNQYINRLKPYWLSCRLEAISKDPEKKEAARILKGLKVQVVKKAIYTLSEGQIVSFDDFDFISKDDTVVIQYSKNANRDSLRNEAHFCDVIAEIICVIFKVADSKNTYRRIFKDGVKESKHILESDEKEYLLLEAKKLLGVSEEEFNFWKNVFPGKIKESDSEAAFLETVMTNLDQPLPDFYKNIDFTNLGTKIGIEFLKWLAKAVPLDLEKVISIATLDHWHKEQLANCIKDHLNHFEQLLWIKCNVSPDRSEKENFFKNLIDFENAASDMYVLKAVQAPIVLEPDYVTTVVNWANKKFQIDLTLAIDEHVMIGTKYQDIVKKHSFGESVDDMEKIIKAENPKLYSLMYFEGYDAEVRKECEKQTTAKTNEYTDHYTSKQEESDLTIIESTLISASSTASKGSTSNPNGSSYHSKADRKKAASGQKKEDFVKRALLKQGYLVNHVSSKTDSKHYDFEYKKEDETEWRYLEVKKDSGGYFFMSKAEKETAISQKNAEKYDIAIVGEKSIHIIKSPFLFEDESFDQNSKFNAEPIEYKINYKIEDHKN